MFSRFLSRLISGNLSFRETLRKEERSKRSFVGRFIGMLFDSLRRSPDSPEFKLNRRLALLSFLLVAGLTGASYFSYQINTSELPQILSAKATTANANGDYASEVNWLSKYLMLVSKNTGPEQLEAQVRLALAVDSRYRVLDQQEGGSSVFTAIRQLESIDSNVEEQSEAYREQWIEQLTQRYVEASEILLTLAQRQNDESMQDSLLGQSLDFIEKAQVLVTVKSDTDAGTVKLRQLALRSAMVTQMVNSPATLSMRSDPRTSEHSGFSHNPALERVRESHKKKLSIWFDKTLAQAIQRDPIDTRFYNYLLSYRDNEQFPWAFNLDGGWKSTQWTRVPENVAKRVEKSNTPEERLLRLRIATITGSETQEALAKLWESAANELCVDLKKKRDRDPDISYSQRDTDAYVSIIANAWTRGASEDVNHNEQWWNELTTLVESSNNDAIAGFLLYRAQLHLAQDQKDEALELLNSATKKDTITQLSAHELLSMLAIADLSANLSEENGSSPDDAMHVRCLAVLDRYQTSIKSQRISLGATDLPETDAGYRAQSLLIAAHDVNLNIMRIELASIVGKTTGDLTTFSEKIDRCRQLGATESFQLAMVDRIANLLVKDGLPQDAALLYEELLANNPKNPAIRNRCFDSWYGAGNRQRAKVFLTNFPTTGNINGEARMLYLKTLDAVRSPEGIEAMGTLREQAELLQISLLESDADFENNQTRATSQILKFVLAVLPPEGIEFSDYLGSTEMRDRIYTLATEETSNAWIYGVAYGLMKFESPSKREAWLASLQDSRDLSPTRKRLQEATAEAAVNRYWNAIRILLQTNAPDQRPSPNLVQRAASYAELAAGYSSKSAVLLTIPEEDWTAKIAFELCHAELMELMSSKGNGVFLRRDLTELEERLAKHRTKLAELESRDKRFSRLIAMMSDFYFDIMERPTGAKRSEMLQGVKQKLEEQRAQYPWWTTLLDFYGKVAAQTSDDKLTIEILTASLDAGSTTLDTYRELIRVLERTGDTEASARFNEQLAQREGLALQIWVNYLEDNQSLRDLRNRIDHCNAVAITHQSETAFRLLADTLIDASLQRVTEETRSELVGIAAIVIDRMIELSTSDSIRVLNLKHRLAIATRDQNLADDTIAKLESKARDNPTAGDTLADCYQRKGQTREMLRALIQANEQEATEDRFYRIAQCYNALNLKSQAESALKEAIALYPESNVAKQNLASLIRNDGDAVSAKERFRNEFLGNTSEGDQNQDKLAYARFCQSVDGSANFDPETAAILSEVAAADSDLSLTATRDLLRYSAAAIRSKGKAAGDTPEWLITTLNEAYEQLRSKQLVSLDDFELYAVAAFEITPSITPAKITSLLEEASQREADRLLLTLQLADPTSDRSTAECIELIDNWCTDTVAAGKIPSVIADAIACAELHGIGAHDKALTRFRTASELNPRLIITYLGILDQLNLDDQKQRYVIESLKLDSSEEHLTFLAKACTQYMLREATQDTVDFALTLLAQSPNNLQLLSYLSQLNFEIGDHETAAKYLLQMNELKPNQPLILNNLAMCLSDINGKEDLAVHYAEEALSLAPGDPSILDTVAVTYLKTGEVERAVGHLQQAIAIKKEPRYLFHLLMAYETLGKESEYRDARNLLSQIDLDVSGLTSSEREIYERELLSPRQSL